MTKEKLEELTHLYNLTHSVQIGVNHYLDPNHQFFGYITSSLRTQRTDGEPYFDYENKVWKVVKELDEKIKEMIKPEFEKLLIELATDFKNQ